MPATVGLTVLPPPTTAQLFAYTDTPAILSDPDPSGVSLGVKFLATEAGVITGLKYYKGAGDTGTHVGSLWTSDGTLLASATFTNESTSGWQYVTFDNPVSVSADTTYVASYHSNGHYAATGNYFGATYSSGSLATPGPAAGVYTYGAGNLFPTSTSSANYWVDVLFESSGAPVAADDSGFTTSEGTALQIAATTLLANDTDPNGNPLSIVSVVAWRWRYSQPTMPRPARSRSRRPPTSSEPRPLPTRSRTAPTLQCPRPSGSQSCRRRQLRNSLHTRTRRRSFPIQTRAASTSV